VHSRGIASVAFEPASPYTEWTPTVPGSVLRGTIITGCSDASIKKVDLVKLPRENELVPPMRDLTFREMLEDVTIASVPESEGDLEEQVGEERANLVLDKARTCWASCVCPPGLVKPDNTRCGRCFNRGHTEIVRSLHLGEDVILSGSYDSTVKVSRTLVLISGSIDDS